MDYDKKWYNSLNKSSLNPPPWVFGVVWPILYIMIISSGVNYIISKPNLTYTDKGLLFYVIQFILNLIWSPLFFNYKQICLSLIVIISLICFVYLTMQEFEKTNRLSALLLIPYLLWISYAAYLNFYVCNNNTL
jgi:tryptophan-rich sensory protein